MKYQFPIGKGKVNIINNVKEPAKLYQFPIGKGKKIYETNNLYSYPCINSQ